LGFRLARVPVGAPSPEAKTPSKDPDLAAAQYVLSGGGTVKVDGHQEIKAAADLPREPFRLTSITIRDDPALTDDRLAVFEGCQHLREVYLWGSPQVSDAGLRHFSRCKQLRILGIGGTTVTNSGLASFKDHEVLERLHVAHTSVTAAGLSNFRGCKNLSSLNLDGCTKFTDQDLPLLLEWQNLSELILDETGVTDAGVTQLVGFKRLKFLRLLRTQVRKEAIEKLAQALPGCKITWDGGVIEPR
jgi:eukaryotic-like serine/threonine-protein kinase